MRLRERKQNKIKDKFFDNLKSYLFETPTANLTNEIDDLLYILIHAYILGHCGHEMESECLFIKLLSYDFTYLLSLKGLILLKKDRLQKYKYLKAAYTKLPTSPWIHKELHRVQFCLLREQSSSWVPINFIKSVKKEEEIRYESEFNWMLAKYHKDNNFLYYAWKLQMGHLSFALELVEHYIEQKMNKDAQKVALKAFNINGFPIFLRKLIQIKEIHEPMEVYEYAFAVAKEFLDNSHVAYFLTQLAWKANLWGGAMKHIAIFSSDPVYKFYGAFLQEKLRNQGYSEILLDQTYFWLCRSCSKEYSEFMPFCQKCESWGLDVNIKLSTLKEG